MDKIKKLQMVVKILRQHSGYKYNKDSNFSNRFNFKIDKENQRILIFNASPGENLFLWVEFIQLADLFGLGCFVYYDAYDLKEVVFNIH